MSCARNRTSIDPRAVRSRMEGANMRAIILGAAIAVAASPALAAGGSDITVVVKQYGHAVASGDMKGAAALCTSPAVVIDDFPPHVWQGPNACAEWQAGLNAMIRQGGMTDARVTIGPASHLKVTGDVAYGVYPAVFSFKQKGKPQTEPGTWAFAMKRAGGAWRISGWSWASR